MRFSNAIARQCVVLLVILAPKSTFAASITFDVQGIYRHDFGPPDGKGALEFRTSSDVLSNDADMTNIVNIPPSGLPPTRTGTNLNGPESPIQTMDGNPATARVVTDLAVGHGNYLGNLESDGSKPAPQSFSALAGSLAQSFSATGTWRVHVDPGNVLDFVALSGSLRGDVRIDPPLFGSASAIVSGKVRIDPFGSFDFTTNERSSGGSFGLTVNATGGGIQFSTPPGMETTSVITFTDLLRNIQPEVPYTFSLSGFLSASLSGTGITGTAYSIANLWTEEFQLKATDHPLPAPVPEPSSLILLGIGALARFVTNRSRSMRSRSRNSSPTRGHAAVS